MRYGAGVDLREAATPPPRKVKRNFKRWATFDVNLFLQHSYADKIYTKMKHSNQYNFSLLQSAKNSTQNAPKRTIFHIEVYLSENFFNHVLSDISAPLTPLPVGPHPHPIRTGHYVNAVSCDCVFLIILSYNLIFLF